jgi:short-subunit dehydrogenase
LAVELRGRTCLVTGASGGIGREVARELAARAAELVVTGRNRAALEGVGDRVIAADLTERGAVDAIAAQVGDVDVLVHAAGAGYLGEFAAMPPDAIECLLMLNVAAPIALTRALLPGMLERRRGQVVFIGSIIGRVGRRREATYAATKAAISLFAESLRAELRGSGVGVLLVTSGPVDTPFFERRGAAYDRTRPRPVAPERVAKALVDGIEADAGEVTVPRWLSLPVRVRAAAPGVYRALAARFD